MDVKRRNIEGYISAKRVSGQISPHKRPRKHAAKSKVADGDLILQLPADILCDILSRIPTMTIFSCRCVSKTFLKIISSSHFAKIRHSKLPNISSCLIFQERTRASHLSLAYTIDLEIDSDADYCPWQVSARPSKISESQIRYYADLVGSVNGLLCICYAPLGKRIPSIYVCNPILGEFTLLPQARLVDLTRQCAFGYCPKSKQYKVIRFVSSPYSEIHTIGTDYWTTLEKVPYPHNPRSTASSSLNGNLHWITGDRNPSNLICWMNLETELWGYMYPPSHINQVNLRKMFGIIVGESGGLLCVSYLRADINLLEVCVMKDYGVKESWSKKLTIDFKSTFGFEQRDRRMHPMRVLSNGDLLLDYKYNSIVYYNSRKGTYRVIAPWECYDVVDHVSNFTPLKDIVGEKNVEVVQREKKNLHWSSLA